MANIGKFLGKAVSPAYAATSSLFKYRNPANDAMPYTQQIEPQSRQAYNPYIERGNQAAESNFDIYQQLAQEPENRYNELWESYSPSKGYEYKKKILQQEARNAAAAGGFLGTPYYQRQQEELVNSLINSDFENYLNQIQGMQKTGLEGQQYYAGQGYNANKELNDVLANLLQQQAQLSYMGQYAKNQNKSDLLKTLAQSAGSLYGGIR